MLRVVDPHAELTWLDDLPGEEAGTGYDVKGWESSTWILHAMYENEQLRHLGTHDDLRRELLARGLVEPNIIGDVNLDAVTKDSGVPLGFVTHPGKDWQRVEWSDYLGRPLHDVSASEQFPPSFRWFPSGSMPASIQAPPCGSLDDDSLTALVEVLLNHAHSDKDAACFAFYGSPPAFGSTPTLWSGPLTGIRELVDNDEYPSTPTNIWPAARSWLVYTDWDLSGTKVSGSTRLIEGVRDHPDLETVSWPTD